jgi:predicted nucleotidyltransferase
MAVTALLQGLASPVVAEFCARWQIVELAIFGSALREDFRHDSDLDLLITFADGARWSLLDHLRMQQELSELLQRKVDLVSRRAVEESRNWLRRDAILASAQTVFRASEAVREA